MTIYNGDNESSGEANLHRRVPPQLWFVGSAIFHYVGPAFAVLLFARVPVGGVAWLRIATAAVVFALWRRPWRVLAALDVTSRRLIGALGVVFAAMNYSFYHAIDELPLGTVAALEFVGPIVLALVGNRTVRNLSALGLASAGVWLLTDVSLEGSAAGFGWAALNAVLFTGYIVLAHRLSRSDATTSPIDRLGLAMIVAGVTITPFGFFDAAGAFDDPIALGAGLAVGISSSVLPYVFDQLAMARLARATYALFVALLPATAVVVGIVVLAQIPTPAELLAVALVIGGVLSHRDPFSDAQIADSPVGTVVAGADTTDDWHPQKTRRTI